MGERQMRGAHRLCYGTFRQNRCCRSAGRLPVRGHVSFQALNCRQKEALSSVLFQQRILAVVSFISADWTTPFKLQ